MACRLLALTSLRPACTPTPRSWVSANVCRGECFTYRGTLPFPVFVKNVSQVPRWSKGRRSSVSASYRGWKQLARHFFRQQRGAADVHLPCGLCCERQSVTFMRRTYGLPRCRWMSCRGDFVQTVHVSPCCGNQTRGLARAALFIFQS
jgi:hypothetical protein